MAPARLFHSRNGLDGTSKVLRLEVAVTGRLSNVRVPEGLLYLEERDSGLYGPARGRMPDRMRVKRLPEASRVPDPVEESL